MEKITLFFESLDWGGFWLNVIVSAVFFFLSVLVSIKLIPHYTLRLIQKKNKAYINRRLITLVEEICKFLNKAPYRDPELRQKNLSIFTTTPGREGYRFAGFVSIDVQSELLRLKMFLVVGDYFKQLLVKERYEALKKEKLRLSEFRTQIESIIGFHSLHLDEEILSEVGEICLDIRSFELTFEFNKTLEELFPENENKEMPGVSGIGEVAEIYKKVLGVLNRIIEKSNFKTELSS